MNKTIELIGLALTLPSANTTPRTKTWRSLKAMGAAVLRDGVYVLPAGAQHEAQLLTLATDIEAAGGSAELLALTSRDPGQAARFAALFDRTAEFSALVADAQALLADGTVDIPALERRLRALRRQHEQLVVIDFFPGEAQAQAARAVAACEERLQALLSPDEPHNAVGTIPRLTLADYQSRTWATRARPWVDRLASAWLIVRHIDPQARFLWLAAPADCPPDALGFDFDGARFTHVGGRVSFETLLASFGLDEEPTLKQLATLVHYLDVGGIPVPEAAGLAAVLDGLRRQEADDDRLLAATLPVFDALYTHLTVAT